MEDFLVQLGQILTACLTWTGEVVTLIMANPMLLFPCVVGFALVSVGIVKRLMSV